MTQEQLETLTQLADEHGINVEVYGEYSGRGMYGEHTLAIEVDDADDVGILKGLYLAEYGRNLSLRVDSMGKGFVAY